MALCSGMLNSSTIVPVLLWLFMGGGLGLSKAVAIGAIFASLVAILQLINHVWFPESDFVVEARLAKGLGDLANPERRSVEKSWAVESPAELGGDKEQQGNDAIFTSSIQAEENVETEATLFDEFSSRTYLLVTMFYTISFLVFQFFVADFSTALALKLPNDEIQRAAELFNLLAPVSAIFAPAAGRMLDLLGPVVSASVLNAGLIIMQVTFALGSGLSTITVTCLLYYFCRPGIYSLYFSTVAECFRKNSYGTLYGVGLVVSGTVRVAMQPAPCLASSSTPTNFRTLHLVLGGILVVNFAMIPVAFDKFRREQPGILFSTILANTGAVTP